MCSSVVYRPEIVLCAVGFCKSVAQGGERFGLKVVWNWKGEDRVVENVGGFGFEGEMKA